MRFSSLIHFSLIHFQKQMLVRVGEKDWKKYYSNKTKCCQNKFLKLFRVVDLKFVVKHAHSTIGIVDAPLDIISKITLKFDFLDQSLKTPHFCSALSEGKVWPKPAWTKDEH